MTPAEARLELAALNREKCLTAPVAYAWERHAGKTCTGACERPVTIATCIDGVVRLTCCELRHAHLRMLDIRALERRLRQAAECQTPVLDVRHSPPKMLLSA
jgi:hypothetical protein